MECRDLSSAAAPVSAARRRSFRSLAPKAPGFEQDVERAIAGRNPKLYLFRSLAEATGSYLYSWIISNNISSILRPNVPQYGVQGHDREAFRSALRLALSAQMFSQAAAIHVSEKIAALPECRKDHLAMFFDFLAPAAETNPGLACALMDNFRPPGHSHGLLLPYLLAVSRAYAAAGARHAALLSGLFRDLAGLPESARLMLDDFSFTAGRAGELAAFTESFCAGWRRSMAHEVFLKNPD